MPEDGASAVPAGGFTPAPGRLRASFTPVLRPVREVHSLDWDRRGRVTPARSAFQEAWPGVEPVRRKPLASAAVERRKASGLDSPLPCSVEHGHGRMRLSALRLPSWGGFLKIVSKARMQRRIARACRFVSSGLARPRTSGDGCNADDVAATANLYCSPTCTDDLVSSQIVERGAMSKPNNHRA